MSGKTSLRYMDPYSAITIFSAVMLLMCRMPFMPFAGLYDDIIGVLFGGIFVISILKRKRIPNEIKKVWILLIIITIIGVISNIAEPLDRTISDIVGDIFSFWKIFLVYAGVAVSIYKKPKRSYRILKVLGNISKIFIAIAFIFGILNLFGIVNMSSDERYGIKMYAFYFDNPSEFAVFVGSALAFVLMSKKKSAIYEIMGLAVLFMTAKGMGFIIAAVYITLRLFSRKNRIKKWQLLLVALVLMFVLQFQIQNYLLAEAAPRAILLNYGFITANDYFPLGSGFGTYGSNVAAVHYSPLYIKYGFMFKASLVEDLENGTMSALNDVYIGMVVGQFGYIALIAFVTIVVLLGRNIFKRTIEEKKQKFITIACFACMCGMFVMAGSVKVNPGEILMMVIGIYSFSPSIYEANLTKAVNEIKGSEEGNEI